MDSGRPYIITWFLISLLVFIPAFAGAQTFRAVFEEYDPCESYDGFSYQDQGPNIYWRGPTRTLDRGENWELLTAGEPGTQKFADIDITCVIFINSETGFLHGKEDDGLWRTDDFGATWKRIFTGKCCKVWTDKKRRVMAQMGEKGESLYFSSDKGLTWKKAGSPKLLKNEGRITDIAFPDERTAIAAFVVSLLCNKESSVGIAVTKDNGLTWMVIYSRKAGNDEVWGRITFFDNLHGWALPRPSGLGNYIYYTADGGKNWQEKKASKGSTFSELIPLSKEKALALSDSAFAGGNRYIFLDSGEGRPVIEMDCRQLEKIFKEYGGIFDNNPTGSMLREAYNTETMIGYSARYADEPCPSK